MTLPLALAIGIISAAALAYEITLMRLFSISYWSHFAWMIISMAMLGYGASGVLVALAGRQMAGARFRPLFAAAAMLFGLFSILGFSMAGRSGFNPLELLWDPAQKFWLLYMYLWLFIPFFMAASCVGICFIRFKERTSQVYLFDLTGAGIGSLAVVIGMYYLFSWQVLSFIAFAGFLAAALSMLDVTLGARRPVVALAILATGAAWAFAWPGAHLRPVISPYKGLSMALASPTAKVLGEVTSPLAQLTVVEDKRIPFRQAPGLSLMDQHGPPGQLAVYVDGGSGAAITYAGGGVESLSFLDNMPQAAPYHLKKGASVLILAAGGGLDVLMALTLGAEHVDAVEMDPGMAGLVSGPYARFAGGIYSHPKVNLRISEARRVVSVTQERYHIIQAPLAGAFGASVGGAAAVSESYLYTVEGIEDYMAHLRPEGWLVATRWLTSPPRESLKLLATVASALDKTGVRDPASRIVLINGWNTATLLVKNSVVTNDDIQVIREFCDQRGFDTAFYPGIRPDEANRINVQQEAYLYMGAVALLGPQRERFIDEYKFDITPATDDRPYFFKFFRYSTFPELWEKGTRGGYALLEHGYLTLLMCITQAALFLPLLAAPVIFAVRKRARGEIGVLRCGVYFGLLGLAFMLMEMVFIQKFALFLGHPALSAATVIASFLVFAGAGSAASPKVGLWLRKMGINPLAAVAVAVGLVVTAHALAGPMILQAVWRAPDGVRFSVVAGMLFPLAFFMGMPFPLGLTALARREEGLMAWAWCANGLMSVMGAMLGMALAVHFGFTVVMALAVGLYAAAAVAYFD